MFSDDVKVWTAIHATIDACARTSASCDRHIWYQTDYLEGKG